MSLFLLGMGIYSWSRLGSSMTELSYNLRLGAIVISILAAGGMIVAGFSYKPHKKK